MDHGYGEEYALDLPVASTAAVVSGRGGRRTWTWWWERGRLERRRVWWRRVRRVGRRLRTDIDSIWVLQPPTGRDSVHLAGARPPLNAINVAYTHWKFVRAKFGDAIFKFALWFRRIVFQTPCLCWSRAAICAVGAIPTRGRSHVTVSAPRCKNTNCRLGVVYVCDLVSSVFANAVVRRPGELDAVCHSWAAHVAADRLFDLRHRARATLQRAALCSEVAHEDRLPRRRIMRDRHRVGAAVGAEALHVGSGEEGRLEWVAFVPARVLTAVDRRGWRRRRAWVWGRRFGERRHWSEREGVFRDGRYATVSAVRPAYEIGHG
jgi:hypothetical protein